MKVVPLVSAQWGYWAFKLNVWLPNSSVGYDICQFLALVAMS